MKVDVNKVREAVEWLENIDKCHFSDITWTKDGKDIDVPDNFDEHFDKTGLQNTHYATLKLDSNKKN